MGENHPQRRQRGRSLRALVMIAVPVLALLSGTNLAAAAHHRHHHHRHHHHVIQLLPGGSSHRHHHNKGGARHAATAWSSWCRSHVRCAAKHPGLHAHYGLQGVDGGKLKALPEGKWIRRFVMVGAQYHISPRILLAIGLIESYGGTTSTAYMGCLRDGTYNSWPRQISCAADVLHTYGLSGYDPSNPDYPSIIRAHAREIIVKSR